MIFLRVFPRVCQVADAMVFVEVRKLSASTIDYVGNLVELDEFRILRGFSIADEQAIIDFACHLLFRSVMGRGWGGRWEVIFLWAKWKKLFLLQ